MTAPFRTTRRVEWRDTDAAGIVHFTLFFSWMEEVEHEFLRSLGMGVHMRDEEGVLTWPRVFAKCDYSSPVRFEDVLDCQLTVARIGGKSVTYDHVFACGDRRIAAGSITVACCRIGSDGAPRAITIPETIVQRLRTAQAI